MGLEFIQNTQIYIDSFFLYLEIGIISMERMQAAPPRLNELVVFPTEWVYLSDSQRYIGVEEFMSATTT